MRRSYAIDHAFTERFEEELCKAKNMTRDALEKAYAEKAAHLSLGCARTDSGDEPLKLRLHRFGEIVGKHEGRRSARSDSASHAATCKPAPDWHADAKREADRLIAQDTAPRNVASKIARMPQFNTYGVKAIRNALKSTR